MKWQEKYFELALKAVTEGRSLERQMRQNTNPTPSIYDKQARRIAHEIAEELDNLHDMDVIYHKKEIEQKIDLSNPQF